MPINNNNNGGGRYNLNIPDARPTWLHDYLDEMPRRNAAVIGKPYVRPNSFSGYTPVESSNHFARSLGEPDIRPIAELPLLNPDGSLRSDYEASAQQFFNDQFNSDAGEYETRDWLQFLQNRANNAQRSAQDAQKELEKLQNQNNDLASERDIYRDLWKASGPKNTAEIKAAPKFTNEANAIMSQFDGNQWSAGFRAKLYSDIANGNFNNFIWWPKEVQNAVIAAGLLKNDPRTTPVTPHINLDNTVRATAYKNKQ